MSALTLSCSPSALRVATVGIAPVGGAEEDAEEEEEEEEAAVRSRFDSVVSSVCTRVGFSESEPARLPSVAEARHWVTMDSAKARARA